MRPHSHPEDPLNQHDIWNYAVRGESPVQRLDRNYNEILQELRVAQTGVQLLLAFLLTVAFTPRFASFTDFQTGIYITSLVLGAAANGLLIAPAAFHRVTFGSRLKKQLVRVSNRFALCGLALLMLALTSSLLLILAVVVGTHFGAWVAGLALAWFVFFWYVLPLWSRFRQRQRLSARGSTGRLPRDVRAGVHTKLGEDMRHVGTNGPR